MKRRCTMSHSHKRKYILIASLIKSTALIWIREKNVERICDKGSRLGMFQEQRWLIENMVVEHDEIAQGSVEFTNKALMESCRTVSKNDGTTLAIVLVTSSFVSFKIFDTAVGGPCVDMHYNAPVFIASMRHVVCLPLSISEHVR